MTLDYVLVLSPASTVSRSLSLSIQLIRHGLNQRTLTNHVPPSPRDALVTVVCASQLPVDGAGRIGIVTEIHGLQATVGE
jgi:hypothetical protein